MKRTKELQLRIENLLDKLWFKMNRTARYTERFNTIDKRIETVHKYWSKCK